MDQTPKPLRAIAAEFLTALTADRTDDARLLLDVHPELARHDINTVAAVGDVDAARALLRADPARATQITPPSDIPPIVWAVQSDLKHMLGVSDSAHVETVRAFLDAGADPNTKVPLPDVSDGIPILFFPCASNAVDVARLLLERGANPDDGESVYHAAQHDNRACLEVLLAHGANLNGGTTFVDGNTPLHFLAAHRESNEITPSVTRGMEWLLDHGADPNAPSYISASGAALPGGAELPLHRAALAGRGEVVMRMLVEHGTEVDAPRGDGKTAYALAVRAGNTSAAEYLASVGAFTMGLESIDRLLGACNTGDLAAAMSIVTAEPDIIAGTTPEDRDALGLAVVENREDAVRALLDVGFPMNAEGEWGGTPLHWAAWNARVDMVKLLLARGASVNVRDSRYGSSPIAWCAHGSRYSGHGTDAEYVNIATMLLDAGATRAEAYNNWNEAPESFARPAVLRVLQDRGFAT